MPTSGSLPLSVQACLIITSTLSFFILFLSSTSSYLLPLVSFLHYFYVSISTFFLSVPRYLFLYHFIHESPSIFPSSPLYLSSPLSGFAPHSLFPSLFLLCLPPLSSHLSVISSTFLLLPLSLYLAFFSHVMFYDGTSLNLIQVQEQLLLL